MLVVPCPQAHAFVRWGKGLSQNPRECKRLIPAGTVWESGHFQPLPSDWPSCSVQVEGKPLALQEVEDLCKLHCLSVAFLLCLPLSQRACTRFVTSHWIEDIQTFLKMVNILFIS